MAHEISQTSKRTKRKAKLARQSQKQKDVNEEEDTKDFKRIDKSTGLRKVAEAPPEIKGVRDHSKRDKKLDMGGLRGREFVEQERLRAIER